MTAGVYAHSLTGWYVYEDMRPDATHVYHESWRGWGGLLIPRGVTSLSHMLTVKAFGAHPLPARAVSLAWHLVNGLLLWLVARAVVAESAAALAAGLFLLHPIQTEAVAGVAYRSELVVASALLVALLCALRGWLVPAFLAAVSAVLGKETGVMALALVPLALVLVRSSHWTPTARLYWAMASYPVLLLLFDRSRDLFWQRPEDVSQSMASGVALLARIPVPVSLSIDHDWAAITPIAACAAVILTAGALETAWRWRSRVALGLIAWIAVAWLPRMVWQLGEGLHERHLYVPMIALSVAIGATVFPKGSIA